MDEKLDDHTVHTKPNHHPNEMDVLPKSFVQSILAANKWLLQDSSNSPKQRPSPSLLSLSFFYGRGLYGFKMFLYCRRKSVISRSSFVLELSPPFFSFRVLSALVSASEATGGVGGGRGREERGVEADIG